MKIRPYEVIDKYMLTPTKVPYSLRLNPDWGFMLQCDVSPFEAAEISEWSDPE